MEWIKVKLKDIAKIKGGGTPSRARQDFYEGDIPWATVKDLKDIVYLEGTQEYITLEALKSSTANLIPAGNIILATRMGLGKVVINTIDVAINQDLKALFCSEAIYPKYLLFYLKSFSSSIENQGVGVTVKGITVKQVEDWLIPVPPLPEQRRIVEILERADDLRKKRSQADQISDRILPALFIKMFGDPATNPQGWDIVKIGDIAQVKTGGTPSRNNEEFYKGSIPWVKTTEVNRNVITETEEYLTQEGLRASNCKIFPVDTIIIAMYGQGLTRGRSAKLAIEATTNQACAAILPSEKYDTNYLWSFIKLSYERLRDLGRGGNQPNLNLELIKTYNVFLPPLNLQKDFSNKIHILDIVRSDQHSKRNKLNNLFQTLLHQAFSGELTAKWREAHMKELLQEMEHQAKALNLSNSETEQLTLNL